MTAEGVLQKVLEGDSVDRFLTSFTLGARQREKILRIQPDADLSHLPETKDQVMADLVDIWRHHGFLTPAETQAELIRKYLPDADARVHDFIRDVELSRNKPEAVTGYLSKEHAYLATGLAHLYALETDMPMMMIEVDFSNMGGTNNHFRRKLAEEAGVSAEDIPARKAEALTDKAMRLLAAGMVSDIKTLHPEERIVAIRTGGDELRIMVTGIADPREQAALADDLHANIERRVAAMGLQDHPHLKAPHDKCRNGFGAALAVQDMKFIHNPGTLIQELDARITETKNQIGMLRLGMVDREAIAAETEGRLLLGLVKVPGQLTADDVIEIAIDRAQRKAQKSSAYLRGLNPVYNSELAQGIAGFESYVTRTMDTFSLYQPLSAPLPAVLDKSVLGGEDRPVGLGPSDSLERRYVALALNHFRDEGLTLPSGALHYLVMSVRAVAPEDPSAQVMMPAGMVRMINNAAADAADFRAQVDVKDPNVQQALQVAGIRDLSAVAPQVMAVSVHNLAGLNAALGHHNADIVLRHIANDVIGGAIHAAGVPRQPRSNFAIAHHGGGNFSVLLPAGGVDAQGNDWFSSHSMLHKMRGEIKERIKALNETDIADFLEKRGGYVDGNVRGYLDENGLNTFANIRDPKERVFELGEETITGRVNGLHAAVVGAPVCYDPDVAGAEGAAFIGAVRTRADAMLEQMRTAILYRQFKMNRGAEEGSAPRAYNTAFNAHAIMIKPDGSTTLQEALKPAPAQEKPADRNASRFVKPKQPGLM